MSGRELYGVVPNLNPNSSPNSSQQAGSGSTAAMAGISLAFGADGNAVYKPIMATSPTYQSPILPPPPPAATDGSSVSPATNTAEPMKRRRGRPRKYADGSMGISLPIQSQPQTAAAPSGGLSSPPSVAAPSSSGKKARGRPPGSGRKHQIAASGSARFGFTPHVITVKAGEEVSSKISSLSQNDWQGICILSANGSISNVTLRQAAMSGGTITYEGRFEILSLSGSSLLSESGGQGSRTSGLSISLAGPDGRVLGGGVAGPLTAASPVQIIVGSFIADEQDSKSGNQSEPSYAPSKIVAGLSAAGSLPSHGNLSESSGGGLGSPLNRSTGTCNNNNNSNPQGMTNMAWK